MKESAMSFLLLLAVEAVMAVVKYLKEKLMNHLYRDDRHGNHRDYDPEFA